MIAGGLFAGATAGNGINAQAGLAGGLNGGSSSAGTGFASAQAGNNYAATGMVGDKLNGMRIRWKEEKQKKKELRAKEKALRAEQKKL